MDQLEENVHQDMWYRFIDEREEPLFGSSLIYFIGVFPFPHVLSYLYVSISRGRVII